MAAIDLMVGVEMRPEQLQTLSQLPHGHHRLKIAERDDGVVVAGVYEHANAEPTVYEIAPDGSLLSEPEAA